MITAGWDGTVRLWDAHAGAEIARLIDESGGPASNPWSASTSPVDDRVAASNGKIVKMYDLSERRFLWSADIANNYGANLEFSPDGRHLLLCNYNTLYVIDVATGQTEFRIPLEFANRSIATFSPDGNQIVSAYLPPDDRNANVSSDVVPARAITLWDVHTKQKVRTISAPNALVFSLSFTVDSKSIVASGPPGRIYVWNAQNGSLLHNFSASPKHVFISPIVLNEHFLAGFEIPETYPASLPEDPPNLCIINIHNGAVLDRVPHQLPLPHPVLSAKGPRNPILTVTTTGEVVGWAVNPLRAVGGIGPQTAGSADALQVSTDDQTMLVGYFGLRGSSAIVLDLETGRTIRRVSGYARGSSPLSPDGRFVIDGHTVVATLTGDVVNTFNWERPIEFSRDGEHVVALSNTGELQFWEVATGNLWRTTKLPDGWRVIIPEVISTSPDLSMAAVRTIHWRSAKPMETSVEVIDCRTGAPLVSLSEGIDGLLSGLQFSNDGDLLLATGDKCTIWNLRSGKLVRTLDSTDPMTLGPCLSAKWRGDGNYIITAHGSGYLATWDAESGHLVAIYGPHGNSSCTTGLWLSSRQTVVSGGIDGTITFWNADSKVKQLSYYRFRDSNWAVVDVAGRFDCSSIETNGLFWVVSNVPLKLEQSKERYHDPGLFRKWLGRSGTIERRRPVDDFSNVRLPPSVSGSLEGDVLALRIADQGGGIGKVVVKVNGKEMLADARSSPEGESSAILDLHIPLDNNPRLRAGVVNDIEVLAYDSQGANLYTKGQTLHYVAKGVADTSPTRLLAVVVGVSEYIGDSLDLHFPAKDAHDFSAALSIAGSRLFGKDNVRIALLTSEINETPNPASSTFPSKHNLAVALGTLADARANDIVVVYLAGHGVDYGNFDGDFYYLTADAMSSDLTDAAVRKRVALSSRELSEYLFTLTQRQVVILDACGSGTALENLAITRSVPSSRDRALDRIKDRTGVYVIAGCAADARSYESSRYAQGILTHTLLWGMRGAALMEDDLVDVNTLFSFAQEQVPKLALGIGGVQEPKVIVPIGGSFAFGQISLEDRPKIPLTLELPVIVKSNFQDEKAIVDGIALGRQIDQHLRDIAWSRGNPWVFVDDTQFPQSYLLGGRYAVINEQLVANVYLIFGKQTIAHYTVAVNVNDIDYVERVAEGVVAKAREAILNQ